MKPSDRSTWGMLSCPPATKLRRTALAAPPECRSLPKSERRRVQCRPRSGENCAGRNPDMVEGRRFPDGEQRVSVCSAIYAVLRSACIRSSLSIKSVNAVVSSRCASKALGRWLRAEHMPAQQSLYSVKKKAATPDRPKIPQSFLTESLMLPAKWDV